ncbi:MAG: lasso peptide biosynthesis PqqD family chaperone [Colwellia sp.]|jgi:Coenzyme PQQ synthesis protein D (PqqD).
MKELTLTHKLSRTSSAVASELDNEVVMMSIEQGEYYGLGQVGSQLWRLMEQPTSVQHIIEQLMAQYDVSFEQCQQDVTPFLTQLHHKGLIHITD